MSWASGAGRIAVLLAVILGAMAASVSAAPGTLLWQQSTETIEAGSGPLGERSFTLVGRNVESADRLDFYGYLSTVVGLGPSDIFTATPESVETARFTYVGEMTDISSTSRADVTVTSGTGSVRIYFNEGGGASWNDQASFSAGELVAELTLDLRETLQRQGPGSGVVVGDGRTEQRTAAEFAVNGQSVRFGHEGIQRRLRYVGALTASEDPAAAFASSVTGSATVAGRESMAVRLGGTTATPAATPAAVVDDCAAIQSWLEQTLERLDRAAEIEGVAAGDAPEALDIAILSLAAGELAALAEDQRASSVPAEAGAANRLAVTALSTAARGMQSVATAVEAGDGDLLAEAQATLADGASLMGRAGDAAREIGAMCPDTASG